ncbi:MULTISPECIES: MAE_28990/MAE_18760 family HEPN-like nuclease [unclassified Serratia (in: enterobacteria)]|uniref:MAE_28990/MAE_18760 family HEPN-like nuclease n=1 Tax=unclassified Serratia (in: enterobacteria) TaxID=2647522 RepID=UPI0005059D86|nr:MULTISPECIES: MAE_28990/MAE_18760 family HEPN-like nuclease [unclassified Serratia (in: enterobacteria)]KFK91869.1 hypothetical protein JV45_23995 [Serratia sp. Ag2]KFK95469.1 hypothetical protein IV04_20990 [Serratia sp. Ag1]
MDIIKSDFDDRCETINHLHNHIEFMTLQSKSVTTVLILKSSLFVAIYNNIEATFFALFEQIHKEVSSVDYHALSQRLKVLFVEYHFNKISSINPGSLKKLQECELKFPQLMEYLDKRKLFSGNLDVRKAKDIFYTYGIPFFEFHPDVSESILTVKNKRNSIAHGEVTLLDASSGFNNAKMKRLVDDNENFLTKLISIVGLYLDGRKYLSAVNAA